MRIRITRLGYAGLLVGLVAAAVYFSGLVAAAPDPPVEKPSTPAFQPTERIDVEQAVEFPNDI